MSYLNRRAGPLVLALLTVVTLAPSAGAQVNTVKDGWLVMKIHSEFVDEDVLSGSNIDVDVKNGMVTLQGTVPSEADRRVSGGVVEIEPNQLAAAGPNRRAAQHAARQRRKWDHPIEVRSRKAAGKTQGRQARAVVTVSR